MSLQKQALSQREIMQEKKFCTFFNCPHYEVFKNVSTSINWSHLMCVMLKQKCTMLLGNPVILCMVRLLWLQRICFYKFLWNNPPMRLVYIKILSNINEENPYLYRITWTLLPEKYKKFLTGLKKHTVLWFQMI